MIRVIKTYVAPLLLVGLLFSCSIGKNTYRHNLLEYRYGYDHLGDKKIESGFIFIDSNVIIINRFQMTYDYSFRDNGRYYWSNSEKMIKVKYIPSKRRLEIYRNITDKYKPFKFTKIAEYNIFDEVF